MVESCSTHINIAIILLDINQLFESLDEISFSTISISSFKDDSGDSSSPFDFLKDIIHIVKVVGNEMNKGYVNKQDMDKFALDILPQLFIINSVEAVDNLCLFDIVLSTYLKYKQVELTPKITKGIIEDCEQIIQYLACLSGNSCDLVEMVIKKKGDIERII